MKKYQKHAVKKGSILVFSLVILSLILVTALGMAATTLSQQRTTNTSGKSTTAFQNADKGVEIFLQTIYHESKPLHTLDEIVADQIDGKDNRLKNYNCDDGKISVSGGTGEFEIVAFTKPAPGSDAPVVEVTNCSVELGDIAQFKIIGEYAGAARALQLTVTDSTNRGLLAHWNFEDNAEAIRIFGAGDAGSPVAKDGSSNDHILTLCPIDNNIASVPFDLCPNLTDENDVNPPAADVNDVWFDHDGQWVDGIVDEESEFGDPHTQALRFNGTSNYLAINDQVSTPPTNYVESDDNKLGTATTEMDAVAISVWVKTDVRDRGAIVRHGTLTNTSGDNGYSLFLTSGNRISFTAQGTSGSDTRVSAPFPSGGGWHHVVAMWDMNLVDVAEIYIDGKKESTGGPARTSEMDFDGDHPFMVGGTYDGNDDSEFTVANFGTQEGRQTGFEGDLDDLRIYDRGLTQNEIRDLCHLAEDSLQDDVSGRCNP